MASKPLKGYKRLSGSAHRYLTPKGKEISEYEYRSRKARRQKGANGKPLFRNYSQQRRFRESQDFMEVRFNIMSIDPAVAVDAGSELEAATFELTRSGEFGLSGIMLSPEDTRYGQLLAEMGAPDWYFWRFWYSQTATG
jgi:hypothetical protein